MMTMQKETFQSRWGFHPTSREASKKLRFINGLYAKSLHMAGAWERWNRKDPKNRVQKNIWRDADGKKYGENIIKDEAGNPVLIPEPKFCPLFHEKVKNPWTGKYELKDNGFGYKILSMSRQARKPQPSPELVEPIDVTEEEIDRLYEIAVNWANS